MMDSSGRNGTQPAYDLSAQALLANVEIHTWGGKGKDEKASSEIARQYDLGKRVGNYTKWLLIRDEVGNAARELVAVHNAGNACRTVHYAHTLPWAEDGARILTAANFLPWASAVREKQINFQEAAKALVAVYLELKDATKKIMEHKKPGLYHEKDYPSQEELEKRFEIRIKHFPIPTAADFRANLSAPQVDAIRQQIQRDLQITVQDTVLDLMGRMDELAVRVAKLSNPKGGVRSALAEDVEELCKLITRLNFTGDPKVEAFRRRVESELSFDPGTVKRMRGVRVALANRAEKLHEDLATFMGQE